MAEVKKKPKLTVKQAKFVKGIAEGKSATVSAQESYDVKKYSTAAVIATENLNKPNVKEAVEYALAKQGLTADDMVAPVKRALEFQGETDRETIEINLKGVDRLVRLFQMTEDKNTGGNTFIFNNGDKQSNNFLKK